MGSSGLCWVYTVVVLRWNGTVQNWITFISETIWYQIGEPIKSRSARYRKKARLAGTNFTPVPN